KIFNNNANEFLKETDLKRHNEDAAAMVTATEWPNDNAFNHSASEEVVEEEIVQVYTDTA
ncbi:hypothetical protein A2U01_0052866, partial [Trifolium medium]|nr:hypothetical protein [Trifolium medium]